MSKKKKAKSQDNSKENDEKILNFDEAKDMTVGQVVRKQQDIKDGVEADDNVLDRYIKQHREDIEAKKFETLVATPALTDEDIAFAEEAVESKTEMEPGGVAEKQGPLEADFQIHKVQTSKKSEDTSVTPIPPISEFESDDDAELNQETSSKKKGLIWLGLMLAFIAILVSAFVWMNNQNRKETLPPSSDSTTETTESNPTDPNVSAFEKLYASFFTDGSLTKLKNSEFDKLDQLKAALDKIGKSSSGYKAAKAKYDALEKAIKSIKTINANFDKPAIVDGELDTTANVKSDAKFDSVSTGLSAVDALLTSAINMGQTQKPAASSTNQAQGQGQSVGQASGNPPAPAQSVPVETPAPATPAEVPAPVTSSNNPGWVNVAGVIYGLEIPAGLHLQRELSRVPYNQAAIDDVNNPAWTFNPGILENIINIAKERGHITGNDYFLEKVNIINGRGYYNLFKSDGTYLFSINAKTGYFVGNAPGRADDLDY